MKKANFAWNTNVSCFLLFSPSVIPLEELMTLLTLQQSVIYYEDIVIYY